MPLSENQLTTIETRALAARQGRWKSYIEGRDQSSGSSFIMVGEGASRGDDIEMSGATDADQDFIAGARQDIPILLAEIRALRKLLSDNGIPFDDVK